MALISKAHAVWSRLITRFTLEGTSAPQDVAQVSKTIVPVTNADELLAEYESADSGNISAPTDGFYPLFVVPKGERWRILAIDIFFSSGTYTFDLLQFIAHNGVIITLWYTTTPITRVIQTFPWDAVLRQDEYIRIETTVSASGNIRATLLYRKEKAY